MNAIGIDSFDSPTSCVRAIDGQLALGETDLQRRRRAGSSRRRACTTSSSSRRGTVSSYSNALGQQLLVVRELAVDAACREPHARGREDAPGSRERRPRPRRRRSRCGRAPAAHGRARSPRAPGTVPSSVVSLTARRYESVAAMTSVPPVNWTRMPVSTGRDSSRDAARATRPIVSSSGSRSTANVVDRVELRQAREVLGVVRVQRVARRSRRHMNDRFGGLVLDRDLVCRQETCDVGERLARQHDRSVTLDLRGERGAQRKLHVGRRETQLGALRLEQDPRQDLHRRSRSTRHAKRHRAPGRARPSSR